MAINKRDFMRAEKRMAAIRNHVRAVSARFDRRESRVVVDLNSGVEVAFPAAMAEGLAGAAADDLAEIEISPAGLGLHWPKLDAHVYVAASLQRILGSRRWMAAQLGVAGDRATSAAKAVSSRENGRKGGRPKIAANS